MRGLVAASEVLFLPRPMNASIELDPILLALACVLFGLKGRIRVRATGKHLLIFLRAGVAIIGGFFRCQNIFPVATRRLDHGLDILLWGLIFLTCARQFPLRHLRLY
jgi:hypothetical protein